MTTREIIDSILAREGGYVDNPADRGGPTRFGITLATLAAWRGRPVTADDVRAMPESEARAIYAEQYIVRPGFDALPDPLRGVVVDAGVNHGTERATRLLQRAVGVEVDGRLGPVTLAAVASVDVRRLAVRTCTERVRLFGRIITATPTQAVFAAGWLDRVADLIDEIEG
jgi:lysozyme family protein